MRGFTSKTVDEYISMVPKEHQTILKELRKNIKAACPAAVESISYGMPAYKFNKRPLVYFASFKNHCSFFGAGKWLVKEFEKELSKFEKSGSSVHFTPKNPLSSTLVKKMVKARMRHIVENS